MNGDILTDLNYSDLVEHHRASGNLVTIATHKRPIKIDYGVLRVGRNGDSHRVRGFREKPEMTSMVSMGIYVFEPRALDFIPSTGYFDFPQLVLALPRRRRAGRRLSVTRGCGSTSVAVTTTNAPPPCGSNIRSTANPIRHFRL